LKTLYIHIGPHKTGTTSLQHVLYEEREHLLAVGVLFPQEGLGSWRSQHRLAFSLKGIADHKTGDIPDREEEFGSVLREIAASPADKIIISAEGFFAIRSEAIHYLRDIFVNFDVRIVFYARRQDETFLSTYTQQAKNPRSALVKPIYAYLDAPESLSPDLDIYGCASKWAAVFGKERLVPRLYAEASDIPSDFMNCVGEGRLAELVHTAKPRRLNVSQTLEALEYLRAFKEMEPDTSRHAAAQQALFRHFAATGCPASSLLSTQDKRNVLNHYRTRNEHFFAEYFETDNLFDPDKLLRGEAIERTQVDTSDAVNLVEKLLAAKSSSPPTSQLRQSLAGRLRDTFFNVINRG
jgi:hypothetical protein